MPMPKARHPRTNLSQQKMIVEQFINSGISRKDFCELHNLNKSTFKNWVFRHKPSPQTQNPHPVFLPINVDNSVCGKEGNENPENNDVKLFSQEKLYTNTQSDLVSSNNVTTASPTIPKSIHHNYDDRLTIACAQLTVQIPVGFDTKYLHAVLKIVANL